MSQFGDKINDYECRVSSVNNQILCDFWPTVSHLIEVEVHISEVKFLK